VDFKAGTVRLEPGTTKNDEGRMFGMTPELRSALEAQKAATEKLQRQGRIIRNVFHRRGKPIKSFRKSWTTACEAAGCPGRIPHDFRRTAVRNLERAGVSRSAAMRMVGHKTEAIYRRYAIVSDADLHEASAKLARLDAGQSSGQSAQKSSAP
jgi:integrase